MIYHANCPACGSENIQSLFQVTDHTVSNEVFSVWQCNACSLLFTQDIPEQDAIGAYYASDDYISHSDTKKGFINRLYHLVRNRTLHLKRRLVINETELLKGEVLDIGCGTGAFLNNMKQAGWGITGLEPDEAARRKAMELYAFESLEPGALFDLEPGAYNAITMWHVLEHVHDLHGYLQKMETLLAPGGKLFIAVPNPTAYDAKVYGAQWAAYDVPRHLYHFTPQSMERLLTTYNLQLITCKPMWYDSFYVSMLSERYSNGKGNIIRACWNGFISNLKALGNYKRCSSVIYVVGRKLKVES